jgi:hypothetical protein
MVPLSRELRLWHFGLGGAVLLFFGLCHIYGVVREQWDRTEVLAHGNDAQARVIRNTGPESVLIEWTGEDGRQVTADSKAGKEFARTGVGATVRIKYYPAVKRPPLILSELAERERVNAFWLRSSLFVVAGLVAVLAAFVLSIFCGSLPASRNEGPQR